MLSRLSFLANNLTLRVSLEDFVDAVERIGCEVTHIIFLTYPLDLNCFPPLHCVHIEMRFTTAYMLFAQWWENEENKKREDKN